MLTIFYTVVYFLTAVYSLLLAFCWLAILRGVYDGVSANFYLNPRQQREWLQ
jgi:hypothetical protein